MKNIKFIIGVMLLLCHFLAVGNPNISNQPNWKGDAWYLRTHGIPLKQLLSDFGSNFNVPVIVSDAVNDVFIGEITGEPPQKIVQRLSGLFNLVSYYDGDVLHIYKAKEISLAVVTTQYLQPEAVYDYLLSRGALANKSCVFRQVGDFQAFEVQGVPACVNRITNLVNEVDSKARIRATNTEVIQIFPLQYASAIDSTYEYRQQKVVVPGVVSVLNQMKSGGSLPIGDGKSDLIGDVSNTQFSADPNQNSVIVRAREIDIPIYQKLIKQMDKRQPQIEITVTIIDVDVGKLQQLGVDWSGKLSSGGSDISFNTGIPGNYVSTIISNSADFMARVSALQQNSEARVLSQPSIVTLNNVQAILDKNVTFYTKLEGKEVAKLESISSGTLMRVTPRIIEDKPGEGKSKIQEIMLQLNIQDGQQLPTANQTNPLPQVQNSEITTQATLKPEQSLLLGGFVQDKEVTAQRGVPLLQDIPLLGGLFRTSYSEMHSVVRLFLIKAKPITLE